MSQYKYSGKFLEYIYEEDTLLAIIIKSDFTSEGIEFFTPNEFSQQLGYMKRETGYIIQPHIHKPVERKIQYTNEVLFIKTGSLKVDFYKPDQTYIKSKVLKTGDIILLAQGGHGFEFLEESEIIEVKQGPYAGELDKKRFESRKDI